MTAAEDDFDAPAPSTATPADRVASASDAVASLSLTSPGVEAEIDALPAAAWARITAAHLPSRTPSDAASRWRHAVRPSTAAAGDWTAAEDAALAASVAARGEADWDGVSRDVSSAGGAAQRRPPFAVFARWRQAGAGTGGAAATTTTTAPSSSTAFWTPADDAALAAAVAQFGGQDWNAVAACVPGKQPKQCLMRYRAVHGVSSGVRRGVWTGGEDAALARGVRLHGSNWAAVATVVGTRTDVQCRARAVATATMAAGARVDKLDEGALARFRAAVAAARAISDARGRTRLDWRVVAREFGDAGWTPDALRLAWAILSHRKGPVKPRAKRAAPPPPLSESGASGRRQTPRRSRTTP